jgi:hypothetical protein
MKNAVQGADAPINVTLAATVASGGVVRVEDLPEEIRAHTVIRPEGEATPVSFAIGDDDKGAASALK